VSAYLSALAICGAALVIGGGLCSRTGAWSWTAPATGLAAVVLLAWLAMRLPGHGTTAAVAIALATIASALLLVRGRPDLRPLWEALPVAALVLAACSLPFVANGRIGELGVWVLDDLAGHMAQADAMRTLGTGADYTAPGYPIGPHALVAALADGLGVGVSSGFTGLLLATPVLTALTALGVLREARWYLRVPVAALAGVAYLAASYFAEGAFKEPLLALFFLAFVLGLRERRPLVLVLTTAGAVAVFGVSALAWPAAALVWLAVLELLHGWRPDVGRFLPGRRVAVVIGVVVVALAAALAVGSRDFFEEGPGELISEKGIGGNFLGQLSPLEALGVWRQEDFRLGIPDPLLEPGILLACAVVIFGLVWWWRRREWVLLAGALAGISIYAVARPVTLAYFSGKALAVVAPLLTLLGAGALATVASRGRGGWAPWAAGAVLVAYVAVAGASSAIALRGTHVRPHQRGHDLAAFRSLVEDQPTIYLGRDNWMRWEVRGAQLSGFQAYNSALAREIGPVPAKATGEGSQPAVDSDSVDPALLASTRYLIASRTPYASVRPEDFRVVERTRWHELWERRGTPAPRQILPGEGEAPGAVLDCASPDGRVLARGSGVAYVRPRPVVGPAQEWRPASVQNGDSRKQTLQLEPGVWDISIRWFSDVPLHLRAGSLDTTLPAFLGDRTTFASAGRVVSRGGPLEVTVAVPGRRRVATVRTADLGTVVATRVDQPGRLVPLRRACGEYVDWYRAG
jgi:hypothetical protein